MKRIFSLVALIILRVVAIAQGNGMGNHNGGSSSNYSFSGTELLLGGILVVLIIWGLMWFFNNARKSK